MELKNEQKEEIKKELVVDKPTPEVLAKDMQRMRNYILKIKEIEDHKVVMKFKRETLVDWSSQMESGTITQMTKEGKLETKEELKHDIIAIKKVIKDFEITELFYKEELYNLTERAGISIKIMEAAIKKQYNEVNAFYDENFKKA